MSETWRDTYDDWKTADLDDFEEPGDELCERCGGSGELVTCIDDLCHGSGDCFHGDGIAICPGCDGQG